MRVKDEKEILALTGLRFVAAFYVFVFHIHIRWPVTHARLLDRFLGQGAIGMSLFFILSGFVLSYRYANGKTPVRAYLVNRFARIYPVYIAAAVLTLPWIGLSLGDGSLAATGKALAQGVLLVVANLFLIQAWFPQFFDYWNDGGSWSISVEAFCYVLLPFLLSALQRYSPQRRLKIALLCYVLAVMPGLVGFIFPDAPRSVYYSMPIFRLPEFLLGVSVYLAFRDGRGTALNKPVYQWGWIVFMLAYLSTLGPKIPGFIGHDWIVLPFIAYMVFTLAHGSGSLAALLSSRVFVWLGKISYCFYSFQAVVILSLLSTHDRIVRLVPLLGHNALFLLLAFVLLLLISAAGYYWIEEPCRRRIRTASNG